jgi:hypothetical protein
LLGAEVLAIVDKDDAGKQWAEAVSASLRGLVASLIFKQAAMGKDAADHIAAGHGLDDFELADVEDETARIRRLLPCIDWHELWPDDTEEEWVLYPLRPARRLISIYVPPRW